MLAVASWQQLHSVSLSNDTRLHFQDCNIFRYCPCSPRLELRLIALTVFMVCVMSGRCRRRISIAHQVPWPGHRRASLLPPAAENRIPSENASVSCWCLFAAKFLLNPGGLLNLITKILGSLSKPRSVNIFGKPQK